jgi:hypothetical protein
MPTFKSKAEERRAEWLTRQYAADRVSTPDASTVEMSKLEAEKRRNAALLSIAREAVVKTAMAWWRDDDEGFTKLMAMQDACAALAKLEGK